MSAQLSMFAPAVPAPSFDRDAMVYLLRFVRKTRGQPFSAETITLAAQQAGIAPADMRHWGQVFQQAAKDGHIRRSEVLFKRALGNGSLAPGWVAV